MRANARWAALRVPPPLDLGAELATLGSRWTAMGFFWRRTSDGERVLYLFTSVAGSAPDARDPPGRLHRSKVVLLAKSAADDSSCRSRITMLASSIMAQLRRTTVSAPQAAIRTLEAEAQRRRVSLATLLREAVEEKAQQLRTRRRPRVGVARSTDGRSAAEVTAEPVAEDPG